MQTIQEIKSDPDFLELEVMIAQGMKAEQAKKKLSGNLLKSAGDSIQDLQATIRNWENRYLWVTVSKVAIFTKFICSCGAEASFFSHLMVHQTMRGKTATRYVRMTKDVGAETLPNSIEMSAVGFQIVHTPFCGACSILPEIAAAKPVVIAD